MLFTPHRFLIHFSKWYYLKNSRNVENTIFFGNKKIHELRTRCYCSECDLIISCFDRSRNWCHCFCPIYRLCRSAFLFMDWLLAQLYSWLPFRCASRRVRFVIPFSSTDIHQVYSASATNNDADGSVKFSVENPARQINWLPMIFDNVNSLVIIVCQK